MNSEMQNHPLYEDFKKWFISRKTTEANNDVSRRMQLAWEAFQAGSAVGAKEMLDRFVKDQKESHKQLNEILFQGQEAYDYLEDKLKG